MPYPQTPGDAREDHAEQVAAALALIFERIEHALLSTLASLARRVAGGTLLPNVAQRQLQQAIRVIYATATPQIRSVIGRATTDTARAARAAAARDLGPAPFTRPAVAVATAPEPDLSALAASVEQASETAAGNLADGLGTVIGAAQDVTETAPETAAAAVPPRPPGNIFTPYRSADDAYRRAVQQAIERERPTGSLTLSRIQAAQTALDDLAEHGITGFTDAAGRNWDLTSYVEMATRTAVSSLWDELQHGAMTRAGIDLAVIGTHSTEGSCPLCIPWLGRTISLTGATKGYPTYAEARAAGWRHPSCRCFTAPEGAGIMPEVTNSVPVDEAGEVYKASQRQRALERNVRRAGRRYSVATTPAARTAARRELYAARVASAQHRKATGLRMTQIGARRREHPFHAH